MLPECFVVWICTTVVYLTRSSPDIYYHAMMTLRGRPWDHIDPPSMSLRLKGLDTDEHS